MSRPMLESASRRDSVKSRRVSSDAVVGLALAGVLAGMWSCSEPTSSGGTPLALSFSTSSAGVSRSLGGLATAGDIIMTIGGHSVDLQQVQLTVDRAKLERSGGVGCGDDDDDEHEDDVDDEHEDDDDCEDVKIGSTTVDLPLSGGVATLDQTAVRPGTFRKIEIRVSQVRLRGLFDGQNFDVTLPVKLERKMEFSPPLVVTETTPAAITVNVAVATWLINADGSLIDPRQLATNAALQSIVRSRIATSFRAFEDHDRDGDDDHKDRG